jgi:hypothetical protein
MKVFQTRSIIIPSLQILHTVVTQSLHGDMGVPGMASLGWTFTCRNLTIKLLNEKMQFLF